MTKPTIELKKISHNQRLSEETMCFSAQVWVDGSLLCDVANRGCGGSDEVHPAKGKTYDDVLAVEARIKETFPTVETGFVKDGERFTYPPSLETVVGDLLADHLIRKDVERLLKRTIAFIPAGTKEVRSYKGKVVGTQRAHYVTETLRRFPGATILNNLPIERAVELYREAA